MLILVNKTTIKTIFNLHHKRKYKKIINLIKIKNLKIKNHPTNQPNKHQTQDSHLIKALKLKITILL